GLWRPVLERQRSTDGSTGERFVRRDFDHAGRQTFVSYPVNGPVAAIGSITAGATTDGDALGRVTGTLAQAELGDLVTGTLYTSPFKTVHTDARGKVTNLLRETGSGDEPLLPSTKANAARGEIAMTLDEITQLQRDLCLIHRVPFVASPPN